MADPPPDRLIDETDAPGANPPPERPNPVRGRSGAIYSLLVGLAFVAVIAVAGINAVRTEDGGVLGSQDEGDLPLAGFAVPDARSGLDGDANLVQDDCAVAAIPCPADERRLPACRIEVEGAIRVCDLFDKPLALSFWFTRGGDCEAQQDVFDAAYRRYGDRVNFLGINVRDERADVLALARERGWKHPLGLDRDGALSNLYRIGGCPTLLLAYPGGILQATAIGELGPEQMTERIERLIAASERRARAG